MLYYCLLTSHQYKTAGAGSRYWFLQHGRTKMICCYCHCLLIVHSLLIPLTHRPPDFMSFRSSFDTHFCLLIRLSWLTQRLQTLSALYHCLVTSPQCKTAAAGSRYWMLQYGRTKMLCSYCHCLLIFHILLIPFIRHSIAFLSSSSPKFATMLGIFTYMLLIFI